MKKVLALASVIWLAFSLEAQAQVSFDRAVSLASVAFFELDHCPGVVVNGPIFEKGLEASGADLDLDNEAIQRAAKVKDASLHEEGDHFHCAEFWSQLGPEGTDVTGLLSRAH